jgi:hypothetical protein
MLSMFGAVVRNPAKHAERHSFGLIERRLALVARFAAVFLSPRALGPQNGIEELKLRAVRRCDTRL